MKHKYFVLPAVLAALALSALPFGKGVSPTVEYDDLNSEEKVPFVDPISYEDDNEKTIHYSAMKANEPEVVTETPDIVKIHYHNDDNACLTRRFYTWVTGVDGVERKPNGVWDGTDMEITLDFSEIPEYQGSISIFFIIKVAGTWAGQSEDTEFSYSRFPMREEEGKKITEFWTIPGEGTSIEIYQTEEETQFPKIKTAKFTNFNTIHCVSTVDKEGKAWIPDSWELYAYDKSYLNMTEASQKANKQHYLFKSSAVSGKPTTSEFDIKFNYTAKINVQYVIESKFPGYLDRIQKIIVSSEYLYQSQRFEDYYTYSGDDLGMTYSEEQTTFKVWSPTSANVLLNLYDAGAPRSLGGSDIKRSAEMYYSKGGIWELTVKGNISGKFYTYTLTNSNGTIESMDPYAKACGLNGMRGFVYDKTSSLANPEGWENVPAIWDGTEYDITSPQQLAIYEVHIRDFTSDETWNNGEKGGTYNAFVKEGTKFDGLTTGYDHLKELGVNAVQLLPVFDYDNDERPEKNKYNWGYNPLNYNCVEGAYSSDPTDPLVRIREYKNLIMKMAQNGNHTRVIMDVVYNHVMSASASCFTKIMPKYYFRYDADWNLLDGSGCNNEVKSDATMMSKYIVDSCLWWAKEYKIKGFRFDLMGLLDSWTMRKVKDSLYAYDKDIYVYGEGWTSGGYHGKYEAEYNQDGTIAYIKEGGCETDVVYRSLYPTETSPGLLGGFNNGGRDQLKGENDRGFSNSPYPNWGFISKSAGDVGTNSDNVAYMMKGGNSYGIRGANPLQTVAYASCHDNYTLWDQLRYTLAPNGYKPHVENDKVPCEPQGSSEPDIYDLLNATITAHGMVFASNSAAFIQGGEELYRSKSATAKQLEELGLLELDAHDNVVLDNEAIVRPFSDGSTYKHYSKNPDDYVSSSEVWMYGKITSHNSYKSPDLINSFKWDRKKSINSTDVTAYNAMWSAMVKTHIASNKTKGIIGDQYVAEFHTWTNGNGSTGVALWNGNAEETKGYKYAFSGRGETYFAWNATLEGEVVYSAGFVGNPQDRISGGYLRLPPYSTLVLKVGA
ncbi:MAG: hypothetical protein IJQ40_01880 [Bacilli bacterium]|nr:hypothetical protein [Bacilli bacterium]